jgi:hypothetical protein
MRILLVTDAWAPQVNGVVRTLEKTRETLESLGHEVRCSRRRAEPCPAPVIRKSA